MRLIRTCRSISGLRGLWRFAIRIASAAASMAGMEHSVLAERIAFAMTGPRKHGLPVHFKPFNLFVRHGEFNGTSPIFHSGHEIIDARQRGLGEGPSQYVRTLTEGSGAMPSGSRCKLFMPDEIRNLVAYIAFLGTQEPSRAMVKDQLAIA